MTTTEENINPTPEVPAGQTAVGDDISAELALTNRWLERIAEQGETRNRHIVTIRAIAVFFFIVAVIGILAAITLFIVNRNSDPDVQCLRTIFGNCS